MYSAQAGDTLWQEAGSTGSVPGKFQHMFVIWGGALALFWLTGSLLQRVLHVRLAGKVSGLLDTREEGALLLATMPRPGNGLGVVFHPQLGIETAQIRAGCASTKHQVFGDLLRAESLGQERQNPCFAAREVY